MHTDLALGHDALLARVDKLDRVLDGEDVIAAGAIDQVHHGGEGGGLARAGRPGDEHQALGEVAEVLDLAGQTQIICSRHSRRNDPSHQEGTMPVAPCVAAEPGHVFDLVGPVGIAGFAELLPVLLRHDAVEHGLEPFSIERTALGADQFARAPVHRCAARAEVQVRCRARRQLAQVALELFARIRIPAWAGGNRRAVRAPQHRLGIGPAAGQLRLHRARWGAVAEPGSPALAQRGAQLGRGDLLQQPDDLRLGQRIAGQRPSAAVGLQHRRLAGRQPEHVGALLVEHLDQLVESGHYGLSPGVARIGRARG